MATISDAERKVLRRRMLALNSKAWGVAIGLLGGLTIFVATIALVLKGGEHVGAHLGLLGVYLPGYRVTTAGAFIGFVYLFVLGYALGRLISYVYNWLALPRH